MRGGTGRSLHPTREVATSSPGNNQERGGRGGGIHKHKVASSVEGRLQGGGDPRVAYRSQGRSAGWWQQMMYGKVKVKCGGCVKFSTEMKNLAPDSWPCHPRIAPATTSTEPLRAREWTKTNQKGGEDLVATSLPGQSNADNTTTKLENHTATTKVINTQMCQNLTNLMCN